MATTMSPILTALLLSTALLAGDLHAAPGDPIVDTDFKNVWSGGYYYVFQLTADFFGQGIGMGGVFLSARNSTCPTTASTSLLKPGQQEVRISGPGGIVQESSEIHFNFYSPSRCVESGEWTLRVDGDGVTRVVARSSVSEGTIVPARFELVRVENEDDVYNIRACPEGRECALVGVDYAVIGGGTGDLGAYLALADRSRIDVGTFSFVNTGYESKSGNAVAATNVLPSKILSKLKLYRNRKAAA